MVVALPNRAKFPEKIKQLLCGNVVAEVLHEKDPVGFRGKLAAAAHISEARFVYKDGDLPGGPETRCSVFGCWRKGQWADG